MKSMNRFFERFQSFMEAKIVPVANRISNQRHLAALRDGLTNLVPYTIVGGIALMIANPPVNTQLVKPTNFFNDFLLAWMNWAHTYYNVLTVPFNLSIGVISLYVVLGVSFQLARSYKMAAFPNALVALMTFLAVVATPATVKGKLQIDTTLLGSNSMFAAIIIGLAVIEVNRFLINHKIAIKMPAQVPQAVAAPFEVLIPLVANILLFGAINGIMGHFGTNIGTFVFAVFQPLMHAGATLISMMILVEVALIFWFFGIHGDNMISAVTTPIFTAGLVQNLQEYANHKPLTNIFVGNFTFIFGEAAVYIAILVSMLVFAKSAKLKSLSRLAWPATLFNINEPQVFGVPTVMNLFTFIPSFICLLFDMPIAYFATTLGFMSKTAMSVPWTLPAPLYALISTLDWHSLVVWFVIFALDFVIVAPFMIAYDRQLIKEDEAATAQAAK
ncbi:MULTISPECIES: PTS sugar transporter subunit IIC [unclassified Lacticaseibacillus]|uniref:PTS sugar transporter subunit IIC n=1 Tax=unclassified Lacticaseibacillus TaxID=2759744 RepID=UPI001941E4FF|nr:MULTISPECIES: PTS transporter subunit EIIC [unclassified Lacticaseibacillus]